MRGSRVYALVVSVVMIGALLWPIWRGTDGYPLSNYPMFSQEKAPEARIYHIVAFSSDGRHRPVSPDLLGTEEVMQAHQTIKLAIGGGRSTALALCEDVARRVAADDDWSDVTQLELRTDRYDTIAYWRGDTKPRQTRVAARCSVGVDAS